jgi:hypothetical protein
MARTIIEWDRERIIVARGSVEGTRSSFETVTVIELGEHRADSPEILDQLRKAAPSGGKSQSGVTLVLPRQTVSVHRIQLPMVPDGDLPDMVKLQASMRLSMPLDTVAMDFAPLPVIAGSTTREVLLVTAPQDQLQIMRRCLAACQLQISEIRVTAFCIANVAERAGLLSKAVDSSAVDVLVLMRKDFIEVTFTRGNGVIFSHSGASWTSPDSIERVVRGELTRARMAAADHLGDHRVGRFILIGRVEDTASVSDQIASRMDEAKPERIDPATLIGGELPAGMSGTSLLAIAGALDAEKSTVATVDLANPRKPPIRRDYRRAKILGGALALVAIFAAGWMWRERQLRDLQSRAAVVQGEVNDLRDSLKLGGDDLETAERISSWVERDVNWLDEIRSLQELMPGRDRMIVRSFQVGSKQNDGIGTIKIEGRAKSASDVELLGRKLTEAGYMVPPDKREQTQRDAAYPIEFTFTLTIPERSPESQQS